MQLTTRIFPCQRARCQSSFVAGGRPSTPQPAAPPRPARRSRSWCASHVLPQLSVDLVLLKQHEASPGAACSAGGPEAVLFETVLQQASALLKFESESHIRRDSRSSSSADPPRQVHHSIGASGGPRAGGEEAPAAVPPVPVLVLSFGPDLYNRDEARSATLRAGQQAQPRASGNPPDEGHPCVRPAARCRQRASSPASTAAPAGRRSADP